MRAALIINAKSGGALDLEDPAATVADILRANGIEPVIIPPGDLVGRLRAAIAEQPDAVVVGGGDGTITCAAEHLAGTGIPLGIVPLGTMNLLAHDLGLPLGLEAAAAALGTASVHHIDVATVNGTMFLNACMIGLPTHLGRHRERARGSGLFARWRFLVAALRGALRHPPLRVQITTDGTTRHRVWTRAIAVSCNPLDEDSARFPARATLDAGTLSLYVARDFGIWWVVQFATRALLRSWGGHPDLGQTTAQSITIAGGRPHVRVMNDGEAQLLAMPLQFEVRPKALAVLKQPDGTPLPRPQAANQPTGAPALSR